MNPIHIVAGVIALAAFAPTASAGPTLRRPTSVRELPAASSNNPPAAERANRPVTPLLAAPTGLKATTAVQTCTDHGGFGAGLACKALIPQGRLALVWDAKPGRLKADGYNVYHWRASERSVREMAIRSVAGVAPPDRTLLATVTNGGTQTFYIADAPAGADYVGECFAVAAISDNVEGPLSDGYCVGAHAAVKTLILLPTEIRALDPPGFTLAKQGIQFPPNRLTPIDGMAAAGWARFEDGTAAYLTYSTLVFDPSALAGAKIISARLTLKVDHSLTGQVHTYTTDTQTSCLNWIAPLLGYESREGYGTPVHVGEEQGPDVSYDATSIVSDWFTHPPSHDYGMMMGGDGADSPGPGICITTYPVGSVTLQVRYQ